MIQLKRPYKNTEIKTEFYFITSIKLSSPNKAPNTLDLYLANNYNSIDVDSYVSKESFIEGLDPVSRETITIPVDSPLSRASLRASSQDIYTVVEHFLVSKGQAFEGGIVIEGDI